MKKKETYGLTHIAIIVDDLEKTRQFYTQIFDMEVMYHTDDFLQLTTPGCHDVLVFEKNKKIKVGSTGGIIHFGFRLRSPEGINAVLKKISNAGGKIRDQGEFVSGSPYVFFEDPDGYEVEVWYELLPTP
jgi:catechol 2,3-dioxygenase-like lactoylglutathione lyase family enzyme